ncbi:hypothetical protein FALCPG4_012513 [Fusarium falciforme]
MAATRALATDVTDPRNTDSVASFDSSRVYAGADLNYAANAFMAEDITAWAKMTGRER